MEREDLRNGMIVRSLRNPDVSLKVLYVYEYLDLVKLRIIDGDEFTRIGEVVSLCFDEIKEEV